MSLVLLNKYSISLLEKEYGQTAVSAGLRLVKRLEDNLISQYQPTKLLMPAGGDFEHDGFVDPEAPLALNLLNWMALFLARPDHKTTAVAIVKERNGIHLAVSVGKNKVDDVDRKQAQSLLQCIHQAITRHEEHKAAKSPDNATGSEYDILIRSVVEHCWPMISHRLRALKSNIDTHGGVETLVKLWNTVHHGPDAAKAASMKTHLLSLHATKNLTETDTVDSRVMSLSGAIQACKELVDHKMIPKMDDNTWGMEFSYATQKTLDKLYRDIYSVYDYHLTTTGLIAEGLGLLVETISAQTTMKEFDAQVKVVWTRDVLKTSLNSARVWEMSPEEWIEQYLKPYERKKTSICRPRDNAHKARLLQHCTTSWKVAESISAHVHPEIELLYYLSEGKRYVLCNAIGSDSELCYACGIYFNRVNDNLYGSWTTRGSAVNKVEEDWLIPPVVETHDVGKRSWAYASAVKTGVEISNRIQTSIDAYLKKN